MSQQLLDFLMTPIGQIAAAGTVFLIIFITAILIKRKRSSKKFDDALGDLVTKMEDDTAKLD